LLRRFAIQDPVAAKRQVEAKKSDQDKNKPGRMSDITTVVTTTTVTDKSTFCPSVDAKRRLCGSALRPERQRGDGTEENMYPENNTES
jgi:hypothetical protein